MEQGAVEVAAAITCCAKGRLAKEENYQRGEFYGKKI